MTTKQQNANAAKKGTATHPKNKQGRELTTTEKGTSTIPDSAKTNKSVETALDKANLAKNTRGTVQHSDDGRQTNVTGRVGKYKYPDDVKTPEQRKAYRRQARRTLRNLDRTLHELQESHKPGVKEEREKVVKALDKFKHDVYAEGVPTVIDAKPAEGVKLPELNADKGNAKK